MSRSAGVFSNFTPTPTDLEKNLLKALRFLEDAKKRIGELEIQVDQYRILMEKSTSINTNLLAKLNSQMKISRAFVTDITAQRDEALQGLVALQRSRRNWITRMFAWCA